MEAGHLWLATRVIPAPIVSTHLPGVARCRCDRLEQPELRDAARATCLGLGSGLGLGLGLGLGFGFGFGFGLGLGLLLEPPVTEPPMRGSSAGTPHGTTCTKLAPKYSVKMDQNSSAPA